MTEQRSECGANIVQNLDGAELRIEAIDTGINVKEPDEYDEVITKSFEKLIRFKATKHRRLEKIFCYRSILVFYQLRVLLRQKLLSIREHLLTLLDLAQYFPYPFV